jgi:hypothetical protein
MWERERKRREKEERRRDRVREDLPSLSSPLSYKY